MTGKATSVLLLGALALVGLATPSVSRPSWRLVYNASASAPLGWYLVRPATRFHAGDMALVWLPASARELAADRHYLPATAPLLKRVGAIAGQQVCVQETRVMIDGQPIAAALDRDREGRALVPWGGCRRLTPGELFLLNPEHPGSFDSRYFGPVDATAVVGRAAPLWTW